LVVIGYGKQKRKNITGSISSINISKDIQTKSATSVNQLLKGRIAGLKVGIATQAGATGSLLVRGTNSLTAGNSPLVVVDNVPFYGSLEDINPRSIKSIDVLKGASAAAAYGASAANGVIEVTTKKGANSAKPTVSFNTNTQISVPGKVVKPYGPNQYVRYRAAYLRDSNPGEADKFLAPNGNFKNKQFLENIGLATNEINNYLNDKTINWWNQVIRGKALRQQYNVSIAGHPDGLSYFTSLNYVNDQDQIVDGKFKTIRANVNLRGTPLDWLKIGLNSKYARINHGFLPANLGEAYNVSPLGDKFNKDGSLKFFPHGDNLAINPFLYTSRTGQALNDIKNQLGANFFAEIDFPFGFSLKSTWANSFGFHRIEHFIPAIQPISGTQASVDRSNSHTYHWFSINRLTWLKDFAKVNRIKLTLLYQVETRNSKSTDASNTDLSLTTLGYGLINVGSNPTVSSNDTHSSGTAAMARLHYSLKDRYLLTATIRRDGYSAFGINHPYGYFPSVSAGWRISQEPFFKNINLVSNFKIRFAYGKNGNRDIGIYSALQRLNTNKYEYGGQTVTGLYASNLPNRNLKWEETTQYDGGLDFGFLKKRVSGSFDVYFSKTHNLILDRTLPQITSFTSITTNLGQVNNWGIEVSVNSQNVSTKLFNWQSTINFSFNRNKIISLYGNGKNDLTNQWFLGQSLYRIWNYKILGVYQKSDSAAAAIYQRKPGDYKLLDVNDDSVYTPREDKVFQGYRKPRYRLSFRNQFNYKNISLSFLLYSWLGYTRANNNLIEGNYTYGRFNQPDYPYWTPENHSNKYGRLGQTRAPGYSYYENASFIRLANLSLSYQFPQSIIDRLDAKSLRIYFNAQNVAVLTFHNYLGNDPETGSLNTPRLFSIGVTLKY
jgi:TonB-linked SusC/RagA family outer membrane protein